MSWRKGNCAFRSNIEKSQEGQNLKNGQTKSTEITVQNKVKEAGGSWPLELFSRCLLRYIKGTSNLTCLTGTQYLPINLFLSVMVPHFDYQINIQRVTPATSLRLIFAFTSFLLTCMHSSYILLMWPFKLYLKYTHSSLVLLLSYFSQHVLLS